jgi:hypothetical protein
MAETIKSTVITDWDSVTAGGTGATAGVVLPTEGQGVAGLLRMNTDYVTGVTYATNSLYRLCRFPVNAIVKDFSLFLDGPLDSAGENPVLAINVAFSDSTDDGTAVANQGNIPTTANTGAVVVPATYTAANQLFGSWTQVNDTTIQLPVNLTNNGSITYYDLVTGCNTPLWQIFGFSVMPGGMFDILIKLTTGATTAVTTSSIGVRLSFVI